MKKILLLMLVLLLLSACAPAEEAAEPAETSMPADMEEPVEEPDVLEIPLDELAAYNGMDGMPAYVAVDGKVYDVTDHPQWTTGEHGGNLAGTDITAMLEAAPHGTGKLDEVPQVGILVE